jgi:hypothetical protein
MFQAWRQETRSSRDETMISWGEIHHQVGRTGAPMQSWQKLRSAWFLGRSPIQISSCIQHDMGISSRDEYELCQAPTGNVTSKLYQQGCA